MFWHFRVLAEPFGNCRSRICDTSRVSNNPRTSSLSTTTTTPSIAMPPPCLAGTTEIRPQPLATTTAGPNTVDNNISTPRQSLYAPATTDTATMDTATTTNTTTKMDASHDGRGNQTVSGDVCHCSPLLIWRSDDTTNEGGITLTYLQMK